MHIKRSLIYQGKGHILLQTEHHGEVEIGANSACALARRLPLGHHLDDSEGFLGQILIG